LNAAGDRRGSQGAWERERWKRAAARAVLEIKKKFFKSKKKFRDGDIFG
jgi:hypothetical protein